MKKSYVELWGRIAAGSKTPPAAAPQTAPVLVRDLPGLLRVEDQFRLYGNGDRAIDIAQAWAEKTFRVGWHEAEVGYPPDPDDLWLYESTEPPHEEDDEDGEDVEDDLAAEDESDLPSEDPAEEIRAHQARLETFHTGDIETVEIMLRLGLDFRDERGQPLLCTQAVHLQAECAAKGMSGKMPDRDVVSVQRWEDSLARDRDTFLANKRKG